MKSILFLARAARSSFLTWNLPLQPVLQQVWGMRHTWQEPLQLMGIQGLTDLSLIMINKDRAKISYARGGVRTRRRARALMHARTKWKSQVWRQLGPPGKSLFNVMIKMGSKSPHRNYAPCEKKEGRKKEKQGDDGLAPQRPPLLPPFILSLVIVDRFSAWLKISALRRLLLTEKCMQSMKCAGLRLQKKKRKKWD